MRTRRALAILVCVVVAAIAGCGGSAGTAGTAGTGGATAKGPIVVGSKIDTEGSLLGQMMIALLQKNGLGTVDRTQTGPTNVVRQALLAGQIDIYPEYTGTAFSTFYKGNTLDPGIAHDATKCYDTVKALDSKVGVVWLGRAPADNTFAIAVPAAFAAKNSIRSLADWAAYIDKGGAVKFVTSSEFLNRPDGFPAFEKAYGFKLKSSQEIILSGGDTAVFEKAAGAGTSGANAGLAYGTDGGLAALKLTVLDDPKGVQPYYQPAPTVRQSIATKYPQLAGIMDPVFATLDLKTLQALNAKIALEGQSPATVAREYLTSKGFLK
jgi:osmoprotectant transport system substrate-binding protein